MLVNNKEQNKVNHNIFYTNVTPETLFNELHGYCCKSCLKYVKTAVLNYNYFLVIFKPRSLLFVVAGKNKFTDNRVLNLVVVTK